MGIDGTSMLQQVEGSTIVACTLLADGLQEEVIKAFLIICRNCILFNSNSFNLLFLTRQRWQSGSSEQQSHHSQSYIFSTNLHVNRFLLKILIQHQNTLYSYLTPVCPYPPAPRSVSSRLSTSTNSPCSCLAITICAIRSPSFITKSS